MSLENFTLDMSQEACHMFLGMVVGWFFIIKVIFAFIIVYLALAFLRPIFDDVGKLTWKMIKKRFKKRKKVV